ncbi:MAG: AsmA-like C-terminal region-containing protein, partial [Isosphaeraceae bacterium]
SVEYEPRAMLEGRIEPTKVVVAQPSLRLRRRKDGTWNLQGMLADPWPGPVLTAPPVFINNGTVELIDENAPPDAPGAAVLRDVTLRIDSTGPGKLSFEGSAKGDTFDRVSLQGKIELTTGRVEIVGDVVRLVLSDALRGRIPSDLRPAIEELGMTGGELDLKVGRFVFDPRLTPADRLQYDVAGRLRSGVWSSAKLPFPINDLSAGFTARDGVLTLSRVEGFYGTTSLRVDRAWVDLNGDPATTPFDLEMAVVDLELDDNLQAWTPPEFAPIWEDFRPSGRVSLALKASRDAAGGPIQHRLVVDCDGVSGSYRHFKYPVSNVRGRFIWEGERIDVVGLHTLIGGKPLSATGTIDHPGPDAVVALTFVGQSLPVDKTLMDALPPDVRKVVEEFNPTGTARGRILLHRTPPRAPGDDPIGKVEVHAYLDLNERCAITWVGLPYPVNNLTGRLELHPDVWEFKNMRGTNALAVVTGSGRVEKVPDPGPEPKFKIDLRIKAEKLSFDDQLRQALPPAWNKSWAILDPTGSSDVDATIKIAPGQPDSYVLVITPLPATDVKLSYSRAPKPGDPGGDFELRMEDVTGRFVFNNGPVDMSDVTFRFHGAPVRFERGRVIVEDTGKFQLGAWGVRVRDLRLDNRLRKIMPPVMRQFAQRFDDRPFTVKGNLGLAWSGLPEESVSCVWNDALVVFDGNRIEIQPGLALEQIQGQLDNVWGKANDDNFEMHGALALESVSLVGQQVIRLESPIDVEGGYARLDSLRGNLLGGELTGAFQVSLDETPKYGARLRVVGADLQEYARTLPGHQNFRGKVNASLELGGFGGDLRTIQGRGQASVVHGNLGELPLILRLLKPLNLSPATKTAFDAADVRVSIQNGQTTFEEILLKGDAFSLHGGGKMDVQGDLDVRLRPLAGRDRFHIRGLSELIREASGQLMVIAVRGTPSYPKITFEPLPEIADGIKSLGRRREDRRR